MKGHINSVGGSQMVNTLKTDSSCRIARIDTQAVLTQRCETMIAVGVLPLITRQMHVKTYIFFRLISYHSIPHRSAQLGGVYMSI